MSWQNAFERLKTIDPKNPRSGVALLGVIVVVFLIFNFFSEEEKSQPLQNQNSQATVKTPSKSSNAGKPDTKPTSTADTNDTAAAPAPELPMCPLETCPSDDRPKLILFQPGDRVILNPGQLFAIRRPLPPSCVRIGDSVNFGRYSAKTGLAYWMATARLVAAYPTDNGFMQLQFTTDLASPTEIHLLAPSCGFPCQAVTHLDGIQAQKPFTISIGEGGDTPQPAAGEGARFPDLRPQDIAKLRSLTLPTELNRPVVLYLSHPTAEWKPALDWLGQEAKKSGRQIYWLYPRHLRETLIPPPVFGATEIDASWLPRLQTAKAVLITPRSWAEGTSWSGPKSRSFPDELFQSDERPTTLDGPMHGMWVKTKAALRDYRWLKADQMIVIGGQGIADVEAYHLARILGMDRRKNVFWYRSSISSWNKPVTFEALPAGYEGPPGND